MEIKPLTRIYTEYLSKKSKIDSIISNIRKNETEKVSIDSKLNATFKVDKEKVVLQFLDDKGKVIKQIPPEELINMGESMRKIVKELTGKEI